MSPDSIRMLRSTITRRGRTSSGGTSIFFFPLRFKREILPLLQSWKSAPFSICHLGLSYQTLLVLLWELTCLFTETQRQSSSTTPAFPSTSPSPLRQIHQHFFLGRGEDTSLVSQHGKEHFQPLLHLLQPYEKSPIPPPKEQHYFVKIFFLFVCLLGFFVFLFFKEGHFPHFSLQLKWRQGQAIYVWL